MFPCGTDPDMVNYVVKNRFLQITATFADLLEAVFVCMIVPYRTAKIKFFYTKNVPLQTKKKEI